MDNVLSKLKETLDALLADVNGRAEEVKVNFNSFSEVFGKEFEVQSENFKGYRSRLETKGKKVFDTETFVKDVKEEIDFAVKDVKLNVDRLFDLMKETINKAK